ncbi:DUF4232 domain-containing protein [Streptomyces sp. SID4985]|uniref:DUF4232 domain-containing protein n=1 Tax=unclassified Streptomyces TaxID=2593676 RepID=UPI00136DE1B0|nr:DUF4232 domain-containing protein [Streptomyces sp. SID4985]MYQ46054.1 DUF4232 domain-containing protein [Streptomyces sp. SID4985]
MRTFHRSTALAAAGTAVLALALTACGGSDTGAKDAGAAKPDAPAAAVSAQPSKDAAAPAGSTTGGTSKSGGTSGSGSSSSGGTSGGSSSGGTAGTTSGGGAQQAGAKSGGGNDTDSYAYTHACSGGQVTVRVTTRTASQRVIEVRNTGSSACGLSYYPAVDLGSSTSADQSRNIKPLVPGGLGGPPAYALRAGRTAYAVIDLDPSGATTGTVPGIDEMNVLANGVDMPAAETRNFPLGSGAKVLKPKLGLYSATVSDAVASMKQADSQS